MAPHRPRRCESLAVESQRDQRETPASSRENATGTPKGYRQCAIVSVRIGTVVASPCPSEYRYRHWSYLKPLRPEPRRENDLSALPCKRFGIHPNCDPE